MVDLLQFDFTGVKSQMQYLKTVAHIFSSSLVIHRIRPHMSSFVACYMIFSFNVRKSSWGTSGTRSQRNISIVSILSSKLVIDQKQKQKLTKNSGRTMLSWEYKVSNWVSLNERLDQETQRDQRIGEGGRAASGEWVRGRLLWHAPIIVTK